jgi:predicted DNA binding CopG/RHH family protein
VSTRKCESSAPVVRAGRNEKPMPDKEIDFSDIPESTSEELRRARRVGRPRSNDAKILIAIRIRSSLLSEIQRTAKKAGKPYQTFIHEVLEKEIEAKRK